MKKLFFYLLPLLAAGWLLPMGSCRKCKGISGKVLEYGTETPIKDATVTLSDCTGGIGDPLVCADVASDVTGSDGRFHFGADGFSVAAKAPGFWDTGDDFEMVINDCPKPVLYLYPEARLELTLKNESGAYGLTSNQISSTQILLLGQSQDTTLYYKVRGNEEFTFIYGVIPTSTLGNLGDPIIERILCKGHKVTQFTITY